MKSLVILGVICFTSAYAQIDWQNVRHMENYIQVPRASRARIPGRIVGGEVAKPGQFPHQVALFLQQGNQQYFCGGSLISTGYVLTAAHCASGVSNFTVLLGAQNIREASEEGRVEMYTSKAVVHPEYDSTNIVNDIAIIQLPEPVKLTDRIQTIRLPAKSQQNQLYEDDDAIISGWGRDSDSSNGISPVLRFVQNKILSNEACSKSFFGKDIPITQVCQSGKGYKGACNGDSGGPLTVYEDDGVKTEIGITSYGTIFGCEIGLPTSYTRVSQYLDFIAQNTDVLLRD